MSADQLPLFRDSRTPERRHLAFGWYGGKFSHLSWLLPLLPKARHYVEPYGGSAAVLLNRAPSELETYNDIDGDIVNFFKVLRDQREDLITAIMLTPFSREEYLRTLKPLNNLSELERARRFYVRVRQVRSGLAQNATPGRWAYCKTSSRQGMSCSVSRWLHGSEDLAWIAQRLLRVQIECSPALDVLERYDNPATLFFIDPPYCHESRQGKDAYGPFEMSFEDHCELAEALHGLEARAAISGYRCQLMDELYDDWYCITASPKRCNSSIKGTRKAEVLWINYGRQA